MCNISITAESNSGVLSTATHLHSSLHGLLESLQCLGGTGACVRHISRLLHRHHQGVHPLLRCLRTLLSLLLLLLLWLG